MTAVAVHSAAGIGVAGLRAVPAQSIIKRIAGFKIDDAVNMPAAAAFAATAVGCVLSVRTVTASQLYQVFAALGGGEIVVL